MATTVIVIAIAIRLAVIVLNIARILIIIIILVVISSVMSTLIGILQDGSLTNGIPIFFVGYSQRFGYTIQESPLIFSIVDSITIQWAILEVKLFLGIQSG